MLSIISKKTPAKAKVVRWNQTPCLIASFAASSPPMVWQFDLEKLTNYTVNVVEKDGSWDLGYAVPQGAFTVIAHFDDRMDAEFAYDQIQKALMKGCCASSGPSLSGLSGGMGKLVFWLIVLGLLYALGSFVVALVSSASSVKPLDESLSKLGTKQQSQLGPYDQVIGGHPEIKDGVPMSADDVLPKD